MSTTEAPRLLSFGCRLNTYESEAMRDLATKAGQGNAIIVNTCAVTAEAERQARQAIRKAHRDNPGARIIVTLVHALRDLGLKRGVASLCIGGGEATAVALELL
jgi:hypothetical protein